ncbi:MAG: aminotransferase class V-fold PLP-dependent enzyme [Sedimenticola sp.]
MPLPFALDSQIIYLNHAAIAPWPVTTADAVKAFAQENQLQGSKHYLAWLETERHLKNRLASLINADSSDEISLLKSTSEALSVVAYGLDWQPGDNVVIFKEEFPSNRIVWESLKKLGVEVRVLEIHATHQPEAMLLASCDANTRLVSVSSVQYADGFRLDLNLIGEQCRANDILFCIDAIQSIGALKFDAQACHADFVMADGHKWMLGPEGLALFYVRAEIRDRLKLNQYGWHMTKHLGEFDRSSWEISDTGTRFECGSPNMLGIHALNASMDLILETGIDEIERKVLDNSWTMIELIDRADNLCLVSKPESDRLSGIITFNSDRVASQDLYEKLMSRGVMCAHRGGGVRFSPHFYNTGEEIEKAIFMADNMD